MAELDGGGGAGAAEIVGGDGGAGGGGAGGGGGAAAPEWVGTLPEDLRGDATLTRYKSVEELARGHIEARKLASSKLAVPAADAGDDVWNGVWDALGRPKEPTGYGEFGLDPLPDTADQETKDARAQMVTGYQAELHKLGVPARLAGEIVKADMARIEAAQNAYYAKGAEEIETLKTEMKGKGLDYDTEKAAARAVFLKVFGEDAAAIADQLDQKVGSGLLVKGMMKLAKMTGEHGRLEGDDPTGFGAAGGGDPQAQISTLFADKGWREKYNSGDAATVAQYETLRKAAQQQALKTGI